MRGYVYLLECVGTPYVKIGRGTSAEGRRSGNQTGNPFPLKLLWKETVPDMIATEKDLHKYFSSKHVRGEWYLIGPDPVAEIKKAFAVVYAPKTAEEASENLRFRLSKLSPEVQRRLAQEIRKFREEHDRKPPPRKV